MPAANSLIVVLVRRENQGEVFGLSFAASSLGMFFGPVLSAAVAAILDYRWAIVSAALVLLSSSITLISMPSIRRPKPESDTGGS
jgi:MFS family permease